MMQQEEISGMVAKSELMSTRCVVSSWPPGSINTCIHPAEVPFSKNFKFLPGTESLLLLLHWLTSESPGEAADFSAGINTASTTLTFVPHSWYPLVLVIIKCGVKTNKHTAFLWGTQWESCRITLHTCDEDNAAVARILNLFYWRKRRSRPKPNMVINKSPCSSVITLTAYMCVCLCYLSLFRTYRPV